jgi:hypothetical protein
MLNYSQQVRNQFQRALELLITPFARVWVLIITDSRQQQQSHCLAHI